MSIVYGLHTWSAEGEIMLVERFSRVKIEKWTLFFAGAVFLSALAFFAYLGSFSRFWADDYCYSAIMKQSGWLRGIVVYYLTTGNRFSTIATVGLIDLFGPRSLSFLPMLLLAFWVWAWFYFLFQICQLFSWSIPKPWLFFVALLQVYFVTLLTPSRLQVIYWRLGILHYSFPLPLLLLQLGWFAGYFRRTFCTRTPALDTQGEKPLPVSRPAVLVLLVSTLGSFYAAGQSETPAFMQAGIYGMILLACLLFLKGSRRVFTVWLMAASLLGTLLAVLIIFNSPFNATRLHDMPVPQNLLLIIPYSFRYVFEFFFYSIRGQLVPYLVFFVTNVAVFFLILNKARLSFPYRAIGAGFF
ncbi:MAG: hypothetical protein IH586_07615, partial [Anaerolineaceae bacterium]|nr:hypothetical protein [Anaerolineaceae bacterium]